MTGTETALPRAVVLKRVAGPVTETIATASIASIASTGLTESTASTAGTDGLTLTPEEIPGTIGIPVIVSPPA